MHNVRRADKLKRAAAGAVSTSQRSKLGWVPSVCKMRPLCLLVPGASATLFDCSDKAGVAAPSVETLQKVCTHSACPLVRCGPTSDATGA